MICFFGFSTVCGDGKSLKSSNEIVPYYRAGGNLKKSMLWMGKILLPTLLLLALSTVIISVEKVSPLFTITQTNSATTVYLDPPTINGTAIGVNNTLTVNILIRDAQEIHTWSAGLRFNATLLECTGFFEGEFLKSVGGTLFTPGTIDNTAGVIDPPYSCALKGFVNASGDGRLAYITFKVKALGVSNLHFWDVAVIKLLPPYHVPVMVPVNIIDVYTVIVDAAAHTVVTVSNSTGVTGAYHSGFYNHAYNPAFRELSFNVTGPFPGFSNVTIPKALFSVAHILIDDVQLGTEEVILTENATHTSVYFTYSLGIHTITITARMSSIILMTLSSTSITLGSNVTISGNVTADDPINPLRPYVNVTIQSRPIGTITWDAVGTAETDSNSNYTYTWTPETGGTFEVRTSWEGDEETFGDKSDVLALIVLYVFEPVTGVYVVIETNSTVAEFNSIPALDFSQPLKQISFNVTSPYGTTGYSNVTIPKALLPPPEPPIDWKVVINGTLLSTGERTVTENTTHTCIYFTYSKGINIVQITARMSSTISLALSSDSIDLGLSVTISGNVVAENQTARPNVNVTISYRLRYVVTWDTLDTVETDPNGNYTYPWKPEAAGIYEVMASWEGDEICIGDKSDVQTLKVIENSTISIALSSTNITFGSSVTVSGSIYPLKPNVRVYIEYKLIDEMFWHTAGHVSTDQDSSYTFTWTPDTPGTSEVRATWLGDEITYGATSNVLTLTAKWTSTISIAFSSTEITQGKSVTISGNITVADNVARVDVNVTILYRLSDTADWTTLTTVETGENGNYTYPWKPEAAGIYEVTASWEGDDITFGNESVVLTLTVKEAGIPLEIVAVAVAAIIVIAAIVVYFVKFRKP